MPTIRLLIAALLLAVAGLVLPAPSRAAEAISISNAEAVAEFPSGITFSLTADSAAPVVKAELLYQKAELETLNMVEAPVEAATHVELSLPIDLQNNYVPPGLDLTYHWRLTDDRGNVVETDPQAVTWMDTRFGWEQVESDQVTVYYYTGDEDFARYILDSAQTTIDKLQSDFTVARSHPIRIWVYDSKSDFQGSQAPNSQEWIAGTAYPEMQIILAVLPDGNEREVGRVVPHEISHQVLYQATRNPFNAPPTWMDEGLAVGVQWSGNEDFPAQVERASENGKLFSIRSLTSEFPYDPADAALAYAESFSVMQFIRSQWGNEGIAAIIAAYRQGLSHDDVLLSALAVDMDGLDRLWKASLDYQGNKGVAGQTTPAAGTGWTDRLITNAVSLLLVLLAFASGIAMFIRHWRGNRRSTTDQLMSAVRP